MKAKILTLIGLSLFFNSFSQSGKGTEPQPKGMMFIPQGSFTMKVVENKDTLNVTVSLEAFWMSNEITNAEYKEYVNYCKQHPSESLYWIDLEKVSKDRDLSKIEGGVQKYVKSVKYSEIINDMIDAAKLPYKDYFTNKKYDKYPVVGISYKHANFYCMWKTQMENDKLKKEGKPTVHPYKIPTEEQWAYVAAQPKAGKTKSIQKNVMNPSQGDDLNDWGLYNFPGNISEWTSSSPTIKWNKPDTSSAQKNLKIVRGGSWKTSPNVNERKVVDQNTTEDFIGFRIVRQYIGKKNN